MTDDQLLALARALYRQLPSRLQLLFILYCAILGAGWATFLLSVVMR